MNLANYAKIGRAQLLCLLGLQKNYKREINVLDIKASGCINCPHHPVNQLLFSGVVESKCHLCNHAIYKNKTVYVNEKNQFAKSLDSNTINNGYIPESQKRLKSGAILLFIAIHFCKINSSGTAYNIDVNELAELLDCNKKTIYNNLFLLSTYGYIHVIRTERDYVTVIVQNYKKIFAKATKGGRGYYLITVDMLHQLLPLKKINDLRLCLRLFDASLQEERTGHKISRVRMRYADVVRWFPPYVKPHHIISSLDSLSPIFSDIRYGKHDVAVTLSASYNAAKQISIVNHICYNNISEHIAQMQAAINEFNDTRDITNPNLKCFDIRLPNYRINNDFLVVYESLQHLYLNHTERQNLANLALEYTENEVLHALHILYNEYIQPQIDIRVSVGALMRTIIDDERQYYSNLTPIQKLA